MQTPSLIELGMRPFFQQQLSLDELENSHLGRVVEHHKTEVVLLGEQGTMRFALTPGLEQICVGDWVVFDDSRILRVLERASIIKRKAAGSKHAFQLIAANIDTVFIVTSLNDDFSLNRIERYLALIKNAHIEPVVVLTKADTCPDVEKYCLQVQSLDSLLSVIAINALKEEGCDLLTPYCRKGQTLAFMGSSGVGKSTIVNALLGSDELKTAGIREQDSKGRHTTTFRSIKWLPNGALLMDTPGMRELQLSDSKQGIERAFEDVELLANSCRFKDCQHQTEPDCAVIKAIEMGSLSIRRLENYRKLLAENEHNNASMAEKRAKQRAFSKMVNTVQKQNRSIKKTQE